VREECLDQVIILNRRHLTYVLQAYETYFNTARPHQGIRQQIPDPPVTCRPGDTGQVKRRDILGGMLHDHYRSA